MHIQTISVGEAAKLLGLGRQATYAAVHSGTIPALIIGRRRILIPVEALARMLGSDPNVLRDQVSQMRGSAVDCGLPGGSDE